MTQDITNRAKPNIPWAGKTVHMERVEEELFRLWHMSADNMRISQNLHVRTSVLNFVICAHDIPSAQKASAILRNLSSTHIARVTLLILDTSTNAPTDVTTWVTLRSFSIISDIMRHAFEQITVLVSGQAVHSAANIIQPLLKPDLPIYLWWLSDPVSENDLFRRIASVSNRVIVDSNDFSAPGQSIGTLSSFAENFPDCAVSDLNWGHITPWRQLVAQFFDTTEFQPYLAGIHTIEVEYAVAPLSESGGVALNPTRAWLIAAWLKTRLSLLPKSSSEQDADKVNIFIRPRTQSDIQPGSLCLIRLTSSLDNHQAIFTIDRGDDAEHVLTQVELPLANRPQRAVSMATTHAVNELLHEELEILGHDHSYEDTLHEMYALFAR
ncbi:MAG: hypothetical protein E6J34_19660 [Chloroflexi bacterium]|nr:MAG: hypothetical protein E6J34_19660 [Chloroflexota bacterium]